ncbi:MobC family plasmid mobilization relaxosome protein [Streptomyces sp. LBUM 1476]|uniref:MobC family plasmid mobilization relaxosome protein n=2 Tax=Streptomyces acidiscabies TaxID=42234 RepID=A0AAP6BKQ4_9ACTN|nr:MobC family plasmid mobilization relaxosome protein [Streptomyces acidiscabies]MBP5937910.1 MobC family plasmid mobilization relaxosome protein [Streptomyces sp. LBUM 1476]MBZ3908910.1 MobC family plasmid mobilization relaxosome protein [Streptomyces acidiscabies]MDX2966584.1 MobC family plasmid mobilization relaxosome protein [Streptomyces acidiscabies]MDX3016683.1 MobC family plasmid mobilization relaxosome protein [Streptomyces acidiscabies]MDX3788409.1 MobC family plasmid mobilization r
MQTTPTTSGASNGDGPSTGRSIAAPSAPGVAEGTLRREGAPEREGMGDATAAEQRPAVVRAADEAALHRVARRRERDAERREKRVDVRYSVEEKAEILAKAKALGITGAHLVGAVVMAFVSGETHLPDQRTVYDDVIDEFAALRTQIARIGTNVNQIAHRLNSGGHPHPVDAAVLERADRVLATARNAVKAVDEAAFHAAERKTSRT